MRVTLKHIFLLTTVPKLYISFNVLRFTQNVIDFAIEICHSILQYFIVSILLGNV